MFSLQLDINQVEVEANLHKTSKIKGRIGPVLFLSSGQTKIILYNSLRNFIQHSNKAAWCTISAQKWEGCDPLNLLKLIFAMCGHNYQTEKRLPLYIEIPLCPPWQGHRSPMTIQRRGCPHVAHIPCASPLEQFHQIRQRRNWKGWGRRQDHKSCLGSFPWLVHLQSGPPQYERSDVVRQQQCHLCQPPKGPFPLLACHLICCKRVLFHHQCWIKVKIKPV